MATKKKLLQAAAGTAAASGGAGGALNVEDVFSTYLYEGNGSALAIENGIALGDQYDGGSAEFTDGNDGWPIELDTALNLTGDFTFEVFINLNSTFSPSNVMAGSDLSVTNDQIAINSSGIISTYSDDNGGTIVTSTSGITLGTWHHIAISRSGSTMYFFIDGVAAGTGTTSYTFSLKAIGALGNYTGNASVKGYMSNLRISNNARYTSAFTAPTSDLSADANTLLLALQGTDPFTDQSGNYTLTVSNTVKASTFGPYYADAGEGGLVWFKNRDSATNPHQLYDTERGVTKRLKSDSTDPEQTASTGLLSFNSSGFSIGSASTINSNGESIASWTFRKAPKFFTCVQYTGTGSSLTINHDLGVEPAVIIIKRTNTTGNWIVFTDVVDGTMDYLYLNDTSASADGSTLLSKSSTSFTLLQSFLYGNASGSEYVAYLFAHNNGDGDFGPTGDQDIIKCGSYTGTGSEMFIDLGFEPQWILTRRTDTTDNWFMVDTMRGIVSGGGEDYLWANTSNAEQATTAGWAVNPTGFTVESASRYASGGTYIYIAIRRGPMAVPTDATDVFAIDTRTGDRPSFTSNFVTDFALARDVSQTWEWVVAQRLTQGKIFEGTNDTDAEYSSSSFKFDYQDGYAGLNGSNANYYSWMWKRAPSFCDVVAYTGNGTAGRTVSHNLGVAPEMIWVKKRNAIGAWPVYHVGAHATSPENYFLQLNSTITATLNSARWNNTAPTATEFTVGNGGTVNDPNDTYIAYLFASLDNVSKCGSYTGTGSTLNIDCGFSSGARFVLIKRTDSTSPWWLWDSERGIVAANEVFLDLNSNASQTTGFDWLDPYSSGFSIPAGGNNNASGASYIFYAVA